MKKYEKVKMIRNYFGLTQTDFARRLQITRDSISNIELGRASASGLFCKCLMSVFSVDENWFMDDENEDTDVGKYILDTAILDKIRKLDKDYQNFLDKEIDMLIEIQEKRNR